VGRKPDALSKNVAFFLPDPWTVSEAAIPGELRIFYRVNITSLVTEGHEVSIGEREFRFYDLFDKVVQRTGTHIPSGTILSEDLEFDDGIPNH
jgi:hypothetical protein